MVLARLLWMTTVLSVYQQVTTASRKIQLNRRSYDVSRVESTCLRLVCLSWPAVEPLWCVEQLSHVCRLQDGFLSSLLSNHNSHIQQLFSRDCRRFKICLQESFNNLMAEDFNEALGKMSDNRDLDEDQNKLTDIRTVKKWGERLSPSYGKKWYMPQTPKRWSERMKVPSRRWSDRLRIPTEDEKKWSSRLIVKKSLDDRAFHHEVLEAVKELNDYITQQGDNLDDNRFDSFRRKRSTRPVETVQKNYSKVEDNGPSGQFRDEDLRKDTYLKKWSDRLITGDKKWNSRMLFGDKKWSNRLMPDKKWSNRLMLDDKKWSNRLMPDQKRSNELMFGDKKWSNRLMPDKKGSNHLIFDDKKWSNRLMPDKKWSNRLVPNDKKWSNRLLPDKRSSDYSELTKRWSDRILPSKKMKWNNQVLSAKTLSGQIPDKRTSDQLNLPTKKWSDRLIPGKKWSTRLLPTKKWSDRLIPGKRWSTCLLPSKKWSDRLIPGKKWSTRLLPSKKWSDRLIPGKKWSTPLLPTKKWSVRLIPDKKWSTRLLPSKKSFGYNEKEWNGAPPEQGINNLVPGGIKKDNEKPFIDYDNNLSSAQSKGNHMRYKRWSQRRFPHVLETRRAYSTSKSTYGQFMNKMLSSQPSPGTMSYRHAPMFWRGSPWNGWR